MNTVDTDTIKLVTKVITHTHQNGETIIDGIKIEFDEHGRYLTTDREGYNKTHNSPHVLSQFLLASVRDFSEAEELEIDDNVPETGRNFKTKTMWRVRISAGGRSANINLWARNDVEIQKYCSIIVNREANKAKEFYKNHCRISGEEIDSEFIEYLESEICHCTIDATPMSKDARYKITISNDETTISETHVAYNEDHARSVGLRLAHKNEIKKPLVVVGENRGNGTVKWYNNDKGFGFILPDDTREDLFFHHNAIDSDFPHAIEGQRVNFIIRQGKKGPEADIVEFV